VETILGNAAAATKAVATGDPRYVEQVSLEDDVKRLSAMARAHSDAKARNAAERRSVAREVTAVTEQMVELDRALPALAANSSAPFAMSVRGKTYRERAEAAPVLVDSLRHAYVEGKRYGNTKESPIAEFRGVQVTASRMLSSDEMIVTLSVPGRSRSIQAKDFTGMDTASVGLVRRVENMVGDTPNYREELNRRHGHALTRIAELEAVADAPFEHTDAVRDKRYRLDTLTAALQMSADSPEAWGRRRGSSTGRWWPRTWTTPAGGMRRRPTASSCTTCRSRIRWRTGTSAMNSGGWLRRRRRRAWVSGNRIPTGGCGGWRYAMASR